jgi:hypothetical protein
MPRIGWIDESSAEGPLGEFYRDWLAKNPGRPEIPGILKCFSHRPDFLADVMAFSSRVHFSDGHLTRRTKEMIATFVSGLNRCEY